MTDFLSPNQLPSAANEGAINRMNEHPRHADELAACVVVAEERSLALVCRSLINSNEYAFLP